MAGLLFHQEAAASLSEYESHLLQLVPLLHSRDSPEVGTEMLQFSELVLPKGNKQPKISYLVVLNITNPSQLIALKYSQPSRFPEWEAAEAIIEVIQILCKKQPYCLLLRMPL